ncbi:unnamed protein product [Paramecium sonneborni]|uniref:Uncharacterized protein n=1 Tax=Paramecium sonneborni TaxID=65129 RepID=A0A8S1MM28_9CILI|nr:unnamed protein product [Paramecium sonneborni]
MYYISSLSNQELQYQIENFSYMKQIKYINQLINKYLNYIKKNIQLIFVLINSRTYISGYFQQQKGLQCCKEAHLKQLKQICFYKYHFFQTNLFKKLLCLYNYFTQENLGNNKFLDQFQIAALILQYLFVMKESNQKSYSFIQQFKLKSKIFNTIREIVQKANQIKIIFSFSNDDYSDLITEISFKKFGRALQNSFEITPLEIFSGSELHLNYNLICFKLIISENFIDLLRYDQVY